MKGVVEMRKILDKLLSGEHLTKEEAREYMEQIIQGSIPPHQVTAFIVGLKILKETPDEITGMAQAMRDNVDLFLNVTEPLLDTCGTGGDGIGTINVSTASALIAATGGIKVAKHGNRAVSGKSGSADVLEALGIPIQYNLTQLKEVLAKENIAFLYAPIFHQGMKHAAPSRKELGVRTVFNLLGPLSNPLKAEFQVIGVYHHDLTETIAAVVKELGVKKALIVAGLDGMDEITTTTKTKITELKEGNINTFFVNPEDLNVPRANLADLIGGTASENREELLKIFSGKKGPKRDLIAVNAGAGFYVMGKANDLVEGVQMAKDLLDSGEVYQKVIRLKNLFKKTGETS